MVKNSILSCVVSAFVCVFLVTAWAPKAFAGEGPSCDDTQAIARLVFRESLATIEQFAYPKREMVEADFRRLDVAQQRIEQLTEIYSGNDGIAGYMPGPNLKEKLNEWSDWYEANAQLLDFDPVRCEVFIMQPETEKIGGDAK